MKKAKVIIGGGFGDEGKGLFTDYLSAQMPEKSCVVRFNGGAQAGHSVQLADGRRHVFSHFGSGTYAGLPTFLSSFFVCNPIIFLREHAQLVKDGCTPKTYADLFCPVTTPYDIMINQIVEQSRGKNRHGSVGVGFGETLERHGHAAYALSVCELTDAALLRTKLNAIAEIWVPRRLKALGVESISKEWQSHLTSEAIREHFIADCGHFLDHVALTPLQHLQNFDDLVFEGAQGLLLDQDYGWFPHVTRSNTGLKNVIALAEQMELPELDVYYLTRSYVTRHGVGPLPHELPEKPYGLINDPTNIPNAYQGALRFALFDIDLFRDTVQRDLSTHPSRVKIRTHLGMSCLDQIEGPALYIAGGIRKETSAEGLVELTQRAIGAETALASYGPTRETIRPHAAVKNTSNLARRYGVFEPFNIAQGDAVAAIL